MTTTFIYVGKADSLQDPPTHLAKEDDVAWGDLGKTLCGRSLESLFFGDETQSGLAATCKTCTRIARKLNWPAAPMPDQVPYTVPDSRGNRVRVEGCDRCVCGCKYWENDRCVDCGGTDIREGD